MSIDRELLVQAREAAVAIEAAERAVHEAQERYRVAVRRLHIAGIPLREIASLLGLCHQRVHQLVEGTKGPQRRWKIKKSGTAHLACTFCGKDRDHVKKLVAGPDVFVCDACIYGRAQFDSVHPKSTLRCSFCGKPRSQVARMFASADAQMCGACFTLARDIIAEA